jgi:hypothetical protein
MELKKINQARRRFDLFKNHMMRLSHRQIDAGAVCISSADSGYSDRVALGRVAEITICATTGEGAHRYLIRFLPRKPFFPMPGRRQAKLAQNLGPGFHAGYRLE